MFDKQKVSNTRVTALCKKYSHSLTDLGNAQRFCKLFQEKVRYLPSEGWFIFNGTYWELDTNDQILSLAFASLEDFFNFAANLSDEDSYLCARILKHLAESESPSRMRVLLSIARTLPGISLPPSAFNSNPFLLNLLNGTLDLHTLQLSPHNSLDYITHLIPLSYDPDATSPLWNSFLTRLTNSNSAIQLHLQRAIGSTLLGLPGEGSTFLLTGPGHYAHQLLLSTLRQLLGSYSTHALALNQHSLSPTLLSSRLLTLESTAFPNACDPSTLSALLNGSPLSLPKFPNFTYQSRTTLWISTPDLPKLPPSMSSLRPRLQPIPISLHLSSYEFAQLSLQLPHALSAILTWAIQGFQLWQQKELPMPPCIQEALTDLLEDQDQLSSFLSQCCVQQPDQLISASELYQSYTAWAHSSGEHPLSATTFGTGVLNIGFKRIRHSKGRFYRGLTLLPPNSSPLSPVNPPIIM